MSNRDYELNLPEVEGNDKLLFAILFILIIFFIFLIFKKQNKSRWDNNNPNRFRNVNQTHINPPNYNNNYLPQFNRPFFPPQNNNVNNAFNNFYPKNNYKPIIQNDKIYNNEFKYSNPNVKRETHNNNFEPQIINSNIKNIPNENINKIPIDSNTLTKIKNVIKEIVPKTEEQINNEIKPKERNEIKSCLLNKKRNPEPSNTIINNDFQKNDYHSNNIIEVNSKQTNIINNNDQEMIDNIGYILYKIQEDPKIGLDNIGATCYMNATIQCLSRTIKLTNYFLNPKRYNKFTKNNTLCKEYYEVLKHLWLKNYNDNKDSYSPYNLKNIISEKDPLFRGVAANDSKDLINFLLQELHKELNKNKNDNSNPNYDVSKQYDRQFMLNSFLNNFRKNERSIISDLFFGVSEIKTECQLCKQKIMQFKLNNPSILYNFQIFNFIIFPLEDIRLNVNPNLNVVNIYQCFEYDRRTVLMQGENSIWCNKCQQLTAGLYQSNIYSSPINFILILNRGKNNIYNVKINFEENIDLGYFVKLKNKNNLYYSLYGVITHIGPSSMGGHFIAFCKSPIDNKWYRFNDSIVTPVIDFYRDIHEYGCPYVLFYERNS